MTIREVDISELIPDDRNLNKSNQRGHDMIERSISELGLGRSIVLDKKGKIIAGNQTTYKATELGKRKVIVVPTDGNTLVAVQRTDLDLDTDEKARLLAVADNRTSEVSYELDAAAMQELVDSGLDLSDFYEDEELAEIAELAEVEAALDAGELIFEDDFDESVLKEEHSDKAEVVERSPDPTWAVDLYGVPLLNSGLQGTEECLYETWKWGAQSRTAEHPGTIHHYTSDYKFAAQWSTPDKLPDTYCDGVVEVNYSTSAGMPEALAIYDIYRKRWLARYWQEQGVRVFVDVNVEPELYELNFLGVPKDWGAFATRYQTKLPDGRDCGDEMVIGDWEACRAHTDTSDFLFVVFGGTKKAAELCEERGWIHVPEDSATARGTF